MRRWGRYALIGGVWLAVTTFLMACDAGGYLILRVRNNTNQTVRVTVPEVYSYQNQLTPVDAREPAFDKEKTVIDVTLKSGEAKEVKGIIPFGSWVGPVRGYVGEQLVFCEKYDGPVPRHSDETWSVEVVEGHLYCGPPKQSPR